jgi:hypothetical protein
MTGEDPPFPAHTGIERTPEPFVQLLVVLQSVNHVIKKQRNFG